VAANRLEALTLPRAGTASHAARTILASLYLTEEWMPWKTIVTLVGILEDHYL
jgi:hypothetical protein